MLDIFALSGLEWLFGRVERRYGRTTAWMVTLTFAGATFAVAVALVVVLL